MPLSLPIEDPVGVFALVLSLALLAPYLAGKLRLPGVIGLALAGMAVGPRGLGLLGQGGTVELLGTIGSCYVFFVAGAEIDLGQLRRAGKDAFLFFGLAFGLAFGIAAITGMGLLGMGLLSALLLGCVHCAGAILPTSLSGRHVPSKQRAALAATAASALAALVSVLVLAVILRVSRGAEDPGRLPQTLVAGAALLAAVLAAPAAAGLFFRKVKPNGELEFAFVMTIAFLLAYLAGASGFEPSVGAFCAGLLLARFLPESGSLMERFKFAGGALLVPFLMVWLGVLADPLVLFTGSGGVQGIAGAMSAGIFAALVLAALNLCAKWLAAGISAFLLRYSAAERNLLFGLSAERSVLALAVALLGLRSGLLGQDALCGAVILVAAGYLLGPLAARSAAARLSAGAGGGALPGAAEAPPERILVAVSNPASVRSLVDLAFLLRDRRSEEPVYPVAVVPESENSREEVAAAESHLAQAIVQGVSAGVPVAPSTRVSVNAPDGILKAARESRAGAIIIGWNKAPKLSHAFFGSVIEQVILGGSELVVVARITRQPISVNQVVLVVPPFLSRHPGFPRAARALSSLLSRTGARLSVFTQMGAGTEVRKALAGAKAYGSLQVTELDSWKELCKAARPADPATCAFVLLGSRPGEIAWHPAIDKLPHMIGELYPEAALLLLYLPGGSAETAQEAEETASVAVPVVAPGAAHVAAAEAGALARAIGAGRVAVSMPDSAITDGIRELLKKAFGSDRRLLGRLTSLFTEIAQKQPIELEPGIVLLHAHVEEVEEPVLFFGARAEGFRLLALEEPVRILIVLCAPATQSPEDHLKTLGEIAALFKDHSLAKRLVTAKNPSELL